MKAEDTDYGCEGHYVYGPLPELKVRISSRDGPDLVRNFTANLEAVDPAIQFTSLKYELQENSSDPASKSNGYRGILTATVGGVGLATLQKMMKLAQSPLILEPVGTGRSAKPALAGSAAPLHKQWRLFIEAEAYDRAQLAYDFTTPVHRNSGTLHWYHGATVNSGRSQGTADFVQSAVVGFSTRRQAIECERSFNTESEFHRVKIVRLFLDEQDLLLLAA